MRIARNAWLALPLLLAGCHNLGAVGTLSSQLVAATASWDGVAQSLTDSCQRGSEFDPQLDCSRDVEATKGVVAADKILKSYFSTFGDAANDQNFSVQPGLDSLSGSVSKIPGINGSEVSAATGLAGFLVSLGTEAAREATIRDLVARAGDAKSTIGVLQRVVRPAVLTTLTAERVRLGAVFKTYILTAGTRVSDDLADVCAAPGPRSRDFTGPTFLMAVEYCRRLAVIDAQVKALDNYDSSLKSADQALDDLQSQKTGLRDKALISHLYTLGKQLDADVEAVRSAFGTGAKV